MRVLNDNNQWVGDGQIVDADRPTVWDRRYGPHPTEKEWAEIVKMHEEFMQSIVEHFKGGTEMSWSVAAYGRPEAVAREIEGQFTRGSVCMEPEESIRQAARATIATALKSVVGVKAVKVAASGSQGYQDWRTKDGVYNQLTISVEPQHGFVE